MRALFTFAGGAGHYEPLVPVARAVRAAGHEVEVACRASMTGLVSADGFPPWPTGLDVGEPTSVTPLRPPDPDHEDRVLRDGFAGRGARRRAADVLALCRERRPDVIVADEVDWGAMVAAERLGIPHATVLVVVAGTFARRELLAGALDEVRADHGLPPDPGMAMPGRSLALAPFPPSLRDPAAPLPARTEFLRPPALEPPPGATLPAWVEALHGRPTVYATLGTVFNMESGDLFPRVLEGVRQLPVHVVATVGRQLGPDALGPQPPHVHVAPFLPQALLLPHCDLVVSHAGSGSVVGALAHGLPSVLLPMGADQPHNARRCRELGVAEVLDPVRATPADVRDAVAAVLDDPGHRHRAERLRDEAVALPAPAIAVALLEDLAAAGGG